MFFFLDFNSSIAYIVVFFNYVTQFIDIDFFDIEVIYL